MWGKKVILFLTLIVLTTAGGLRKTEHTSYTVPDTHKFISAEYLNYYSVPTDYFEYSNNGGCLSGQLLKNAFDRNFLSVFKSEQLNTDDFKNSITVNFKKPVKLEKLLYQCEKFYARGYPIVLTIYFKNENGEEIKNIVYKTTKTESKIVFDFGEIITCSSLVFEFTDITPNQQKMATVRDLIFYQPETEESADFENLYTDYNELTVTPKYNSVEKIQELGNSLKDFICYESYIKPALDRAIKVIKGEIKFDPKRQFTTNPDDEYVTIRRYGNIRSYALNTLRMAWYGINKQATGIQGVTGEKFRVYVEAEEGDKIPQFVFSQFYGSWRGWQDKKQLKRGTNEFTFTSFYETTNPAMMKGGPVYIENSYNDKEQSSNVKIYIEGGSFFPLFRKGDDEEAYKEELAKYVESYDKNSQFDMTELEGTRILHTVHAGFASNIYNSRTSPKSPQKNLEYWDEWLLKLLNFYGIKYDPTDPLYNEMNWHLGINVRMAQPFGAAYAITDHVGIFHDSWESAAVYSESLGWGFAHEVGHTMDGVDRTVSETTNNMVSKYEEVVVSGIAERGDFDKNVAALSSDKITERTYWTDNKLNFLIWWLIESHHIGYWGESENMYRYHRNNLPKTERLIYYASIITGIDLSYYFERWGYLMDTKEAAFKYTNSSDEFKAMMDQAVEEGKVRRDIQPKLWYYDKKEYTIRASGANLNLYTEDQSITPISVDRTKVVENGEVKYKYTILLPEQTSEAHLGYEILEGNDADGYVVVGFNYGTLVADDTAYPESYIPTYIVKAYDRNLNHTGGKVKTQFIPQIVCRLGENEYYSVADAVDKANSGDTIYLTKDFSETGIEIKKSITIEADESLSSVTLKRGGIGGIFIVKSGGVLTIKDKRIIIDGKGMSQTGPLVSVEGGTVNFENLTFQNGISTSKGGAILKNDGTVNLKNVIFKNNKAQYGGAVASANPRGNINDNGSTYEGNEATVEGGAVAAKCGSKIQYSTFKNNKAVRGGAISNYEGGVMTIEGNLFVSNTAAKGGAISADGKTTVLSNNFVKNEATEVGSALLHSASGGTRSVTFTNNTISEGIAEANNGEDIYVDAKNAQFTIPKNLVEKEKAGTIFVASGNVEFYQVPKGLGLPESLPTQVTAESGKTVLVATGIKIKLSGGISDEDISFLGKTKVTFQDLLENKSIYYLTSESSFIPKYIIASPQVAEGNYIAWEKEGVYYLDDAEVSVSGKAAEFKMVSLPKIKVTIQVAEGVEEVYYVRKGESFALPSLKNEKYIPSGKVFGGYEVNGVQYLKGTVIVINSEVVLKPYYIQKSERTSETNETEKTLDENESEKEPSNKLAIAVYIGIGVLALCAIAIGTYLICMVRQRKNKNLLNNLTNAEEDHSEA